ncbi:MAG: hypothetical protein ABSB42_09380 [Tepidisphaeraceae bacterium]|jgi:hypothetical protein
MRESHDSLPQHQPIDYAGPGAFGGQPSAGAAFPAQGLRIVGFFSLVVSILTLLLGGYLLWESFKKMSQAARDIRDLSARGPFVVSFGNELSYTGSRWESVILAGLLLLPVLLLLAAAMLLRSDGRRLILHWIYIPLQSLASIALAIWFILNSPAGILFYVGAILCLIGFAYPIFLLPLLLFAAR